MTPTDPDPDLLALLDEVRALVGHPDADYLWTSWLDADHAGDEIDALRARVALGEVPSGHLEIIFAPTGPLQELCMTSGWGDDFLHLGDRHDALAIPPDEPARAAFRCSACTTVAGVVEVAVDRTQAVREGITGRLTTVLSPSGGEAVRRAVRRVDAAALYGIDRELAVFWCPECATTYCHDHWTTRDVFDEDGFHDSIRGRCPAGHERMLED